MSSPGKNEKMLDLEKGLSLSPEDMRAMSEPPRPGKWNLLEYITFLEEIGAFRTRKTEVKIYPEPFKL